VKEADEKTREYMVKIFGRFMLAEIPMKEEMRVVPFAGQQVQIEEVSFADPKHPVLEDLRKTAKECGLNLRVWYPGMVATMELDTNRLNVHIEKHSDGKWRIAERMNLDASPAIMRSMAEIIARGIDSAMNVRKPLQLKRAPSP
jgi:hypothetical protein